MELSELRTAREIAREEMAASWRIRWAVRLTWLPGWIHIQGLKLRARAHR